MSCRKYILIALLLVVFCFSAAVTLWANGETPEIFMNALSQPIDLASARNQGIPIFIKTGPIVGYPLEFFIWCEDVSGNTEYLEYLDGEWQWQPGPTPHTLGLIMTFPSYINLNLPLPSFDGAAISDSDRFTFHVCIDSIIDGNVPGNDQAEQSYACAERQVMSCESCQPKNLRISGLEDDNKTLRINYVQGQVSTIPNLSFKDNCGMFVGCQVVKVPKFVDSALKNEWVIGNLSLPIVDNPSPGTGILGVNCTVGDQTISKDITVVLSASQDKPSGCDGTIGFEYNDRVTSKITKKPSTSQLDISVVCREGFLGLRRSPYDLADARIESSNESCFSARKVGSDRIRITHPSSTACSGTLKVTSGSISGSLPISFASGPTPSPTPTPTHTTSKINVYPTEIFETMDSGQQKSKTIDINCSGLAPSTCSAKSSGEGWLSVSPCTTRVTTKNLTISINSAGLSPGKEYEGSVRISANCGTKTVPIKLTVKGVCNATKVVLDPQSLSISVEQGKNATAQNVEVKDNCGNPVSFKVMKVDMKDHDWGITTDPALKGKGTGKLSLSFNTSSLGVKDGYKAYIEIETNATTLDLPVKLDVKEKGSQPKPPSGNYISLESHTPVINYFAPGEIKIYRFRSSSKWGNSEKDQYPIAIRVEDFDSYKTNGYDYYVMLRKDAPPDKSDYDKIRNKWMTGSIKSSGKYGDIYYDFCRDVSRVLKVRENYGYGPWYLWIYNLCNSTEKLRVTFSGPPQ